MKLCKDCKHFVSAANPMANAGYGPNYREPMCAHPIARHSVVDGSLQTPCVKARGEDGATDKSICWPDAKLFEPRSKADPVDPLICLSHTGTYGGTQPEETERDRSFWERAQKWFI